MIHMIKTMSIFENIYLVDIDEPNLSVDKAQNIVDEGTANFYQHHNGELVKNVTVWPTKESAVDWLHENDYW